MNDLRRYQSYAVVLAALTATVLPALADQTKTEGKTSCCSGTQAPTLDTAFSTDWTREVPEDNCDPVRFHQARFLIEANKDFIKEALPLHERMQNQILIAKTLKGKADMLINRIPNVAPPKLKGAALDSAVKDYTTDLRAFVNDVETYRQNLQTFRVTIGECQRAENTFRSQQGLYDLHCDQFHVTNIGAVVEAPHICGALNITQGESSRIANMLRADQARLQRTMTDVNTTASLVNESRSLVAANLTASAMDSRRQQGEEALARQFGRLKEQYEMLQIQSKMLGAQKQKEAGKIVSQSVKARVIHK